MFILKKKIKMLLIGEMMAGQLKKRNQTFTIMYVKTEGFHKLTCIKTCNLFNSVVSQLEFSR